MVNVKLYTLLFMCIDKKSPEKSVCVTSVFQKKKDAVLQMEEDFGDVQSDVDRRLETTHEASLDDNRAKISCGTKENVEFIYRWVIQPSTVKLNPKELKKC